MPSWTYIDDNSEPMSDSDIALCDELARQLTNIRDNAERRQWARQSDAEDGRDYECDDETTMSVVTARKRVQAMREQAEEDAIEAKLAELGARIMRPYEHWNEDEAYMQYSERDRDY